MAALIEMLPRAGRVLDVGCGYGRIALPLARAGYDVQGIDISENLIKAAVAAADAEGLRLAFATASMMSLPYPSDSFDVVVCLWSAFHELLETEEQTRAMREMLRVLGPGGLAVIEGPTYEEASEQEIQTGDRRGPGYRVAWDIVGGILNPHYVHDESSLRLVCDAAGIARHEVVERDWAGRQRLVVRFHKPASAGQ